VRGATATPIREGTRLAHSQVRFDIKVQRSKAGVEIKLGGNMNEVAGVKLLQLLNEDGRDFAFELSEIDSINSLGVRAWIDFIRSFEDGRNLEFRACSPVFLSQMFLLDATIGKSKVRSILVRGVCAACEGETNKLLDIATAGKSLTVATLRGTCPSCRGVTNYVDDEGEILEFIEKQAQRLSKT